MSAKPTYSKATIGGHPIHVMLVSFPIAFYNAALTALIVYGVNGSLFAYRLSYVGFLAGAAVALVAAVFGLIDLFGLPRDSAAQRTGFKHMAVNILATLLFAGAGAMLYASYWGTPSLPDSPELSWLPALLLALAGIASTMAGAWLGWRLVQVHHAGVDDRPKAIREEPYEDHDDLPLPPPPPPSNGHSRPYDARHGL
jgi:uncharacterized membrane protein